MIYQVVPFYFSFIQSYLKTFHTFTIYLHCSAYQLNMQTLSKVKRQLRDRINILSATEHNEIFKIISETGYSFSKNNNGIFYNMSEFDEELVNRIDKFVTYCIENNRELDEYARKISECKMTNNFDNLSAISLNNVINTRLENTCNDWTTVMAEVKDKEKVMAFVNYLESGIDERIFAKKNHSKYLNAKKRYAKKQTADKKFDLDMQNNLIEEPYLFE